MALIHLVSFAWFLCAFLSQSNVFLQECQWTRRLSLACDDALDMCYRCLRGPVVFSVFLMYGGLRKYVSSPGHQVQS
jgi:hypothetical protein